MTIGSECCGRMKFSSSPMHSFNCNWYLTTFRVIFHDVLITAGHILLLLMPVSFIVPAGYISLSSFFVLPCLHYLNADANMLIAPV